MDLKDALFELINMRSFSNLWFWIALAVMWSRASHWVIGVPYDLVLRARRNGGGSAADMEDLVRINVARILHIGQMSGLWLTGLSCFMLTGLGLLGFVYWVEFAQALFLLGLPMTLVGLLRLNTARLIHDNTAASDEVLYKRLFRHRVFVQIIGIISIFVTAMFGMYTNLALGPFGY